MRNPTDPRPVLILAVVALLVALAAAGAAVLGMPPEQLAPRLWRGYYTLFAEPAAGLPALASALGQCPGVEAVVSRYTSPASFNSFDGFTTVPVAELGVRLDPQDPRYDPYLRGLQAYFRDGQAAGSPELMYVRSDRSAAWLLRLLRRLPEAKGLRLRLLEAGSAAVLRLVLFCAFGLLLAARQEAWSLRLLAVAAALPWFPAVCFGSGLTLVAALALLPLWPALLASAYPFLRERLFAPAGGRRAAASQGRPAPRRVAASRAAARLLPPLVAGLLLLLLLERAGQPLGALALAGASGLLLLPLLYAGLTLELVLREHVPFLPVPILAPSRAGSPHRRRGAIVAALLIGLAVLSLPALTLGARLDRRFVPAPGRPPAEGAGLSWAALEALAAESERRALPDLADYLSHRAYQEGLAFGRPYTFPSLGERLVIPAFAPDSSGQGVVRADRVALRYPDTWLALTLDSAPPGSVARLLADQGQGLPVQVLPLGSVGPFGAGLPEGPTVGLGLCALLLLWLLLAPGGFDLTASALCAKRGSALRRKRLAV